MEDEIDLRVYINVLIRYWRLIVGLTVVAGVVAFVVSLLLPAAYQATAVVVVTRPLYQFQLAPGIQNLPENTAAAAHGSLRQGCAGPGEQRCDDSAAFGSGGQ